MTKNSNKNQSNTVFMEERLSYKSNLVMFISYTILAFFILSMLDPSIAFAVNIDLDKVGDTTLGKLQTVVNKYYPAGIFTSGIGGMVVAQGDLKTRAIGLGTGAGLAGLVVWGIKEGFGMAA